MIPRDAVNRMARGEVLTNSIGIAVFGDEDSVASLMGATAAMVNTFKIKIGTPGWTVEEEVEHFRYSSIRKLAEVSSGKANLLGLVAFIIHWLAFNAALNGGVEYRRLPVRSPNGREFQVLVAWIRGGTVTFDDLMGEVGKRLIDGNSGSAG